MKHTELLYLMSLGNEKENHPLCVPFNELACHSK